MILIYGLRKGESERYTEELLSSNCATAADVAKVKAAAARDGWHSFRVVKATEGMPDFVGAIAGIKRKRK